MKVIPGSELYESEDNDIVLWRGKPFTGICHEQDEDLRIWSVSSYFEGEPHGPQRVWRTDGRLHFERYFFRWRRHGPYREWNDAGELRKDSYYDRGILIKELEWDEAGRLRGEYLLWDNGSPTM